MTALTLSTSSAATLRADAVVVGVAKGAKGVVAAPGAEAVDKAFGGKLAAVLETLGASGAEGEVTKLPAADGLKAPVVLAVGLGEAPAKGDGYTTRRCAAPQAAPPARWPAPRRPPSPCRWRTPRRPPRCPRARCWARTPSPRTAAAARRAKAGKVDNGRSAPLAEVAILGAKPRDKEFKAAVERAQALAAEINRARDLINMPPNDLDPKAFAAQAQAAAKEFGLKVEVLDEKALKKGGYGGLMGVGQGPRRRRGWCGSRTPTPRPKKTLALVGKGITYDSGGISLKPAGHNETMKCDMSGAAAVFAAVVTAARLGLEVNVTGWLALAENMPSGSATRPGDVLTMYSGKTVEVLNTDAEGRLVLADALTRASEESPDAIVDVATLTGAMVLALGNRTFGIMANDDAFRTSIHEIAEEVGEQSWPMPMPSELRKGMDSPIADIANMGERMGGGLVAGLFLKEFIGEGITWAHLDIAGPAFHEGAPCGYTPKGGTGSAVRTLVRLAERTAAGDLG